MEVKIGVQDTAREIVLEVSATPDAVEAQVTTALSGAAGVLSLADDKGRKVLVPAAKIAYVEIGEASERRVGFGSR